MKDGLQGKLSTMVIGDDISAILVSFDNIKDAEEFDELLSSHTIRWALKDNKIQYDVYFRFSGLGLGCTVSKEIGDKFDNATVILCSHLSNGYTQFLPEKPLNRTLHPTHR